MSYRRGHGRRQTLQGVEQTAYAGNGQVPLTGASNGPEGERTIQEQTAATVFRRPSSHI